MKDTVRVGVVGTSWYADLLHLPMLKSHAQAQTAAICGRNRARAEEMAEKYGIPRVFTDYRDLMNRDLLDAVIIAVPDDMHYPITMAALDAGLHVLGEKPMALNLDQAREMLAKAEAAQVKHMTFFTWRWTPYNRMMQKLVHEGYIGECYEARFEYLASFARDGAYQWKWDHKHGLGVLGDLGSHMIDLAHLLVGDIMQVQARLNIHVPKPHPNGVSYEPANDSAQLAVQFANGAVGSIHTSAVAELGDHGQIQRVQLTGSEGTLEMTADLISYTVRGVRRGEQKFQTFSIPGAFLEGSDPNQTTFVQVSQTFAQQSIGTRLFIDSILTNCPIEPSFRDGAKAQAVIDAAFQSDASRCWEPVPQVAAL